MHSATGTHSHEADCQCIQYYAIRKGPGQQIAKSQLPKRSEQIQPVEHLQCNHASMRTRQLQEFDSWRQPRRKIKLVCCRRTLRACRIFSSQLGLQPQYEPQEDYATVIGDCKIFS